MNSFDALYYPGFEPPATWLRSMLLFYDSMRTIVPEDARKDLSDDYFRLSEAIDNNLQPIAPNYDDIRLTSEKLDRLRRAFEIIKDELPENHARAAQIVIGPSGELRIHGHVFMRHEKLSHEVRWLLENMGLLRHDLQSLADGAGANGYLVVNEQASSLILSYIADSMSRRHGWSALTEEPVALAVNALNSLPRSPRDEAAVKLASAIVRVEIPQEVEQLPLQQYLEVRKAFGDIREPFHRMIYELTDFAGLARIEDQAALGDKINRIAHGFDEEVGKLRGSKALSFVRRWTPLFVGGLASVAGAIGTPEIGVVCATVGIGIQVIQETTQFGARPCEKEEVQRLIAGLQDRLLEPSLLNRLI